MNSIVKKLFALSLLACIPVLAGCGKDSPMGPKVAAKPESLDVTVKLVRLYTPADGDGIIDGAGEFEYRAYVTDGAQLIDVSGQVSLNDGDTHPLNKTRVYRVPKGKGYQIDVKFFGTEWDKDIFGYVYPDTRMDHLYENRIHSDATPSSSFNDGERWITLGEGDLRLRLIYTITSQPVL